MDHKSALADLGVSEKTLSADEKRALDTEGWLLFSDAFTRSQSEAMRIAIDRILDEQLITGMEHTTDPGSDMVFGITGRDPAFAPILLEPRAWAAAKHLFGDEEFYGGHENFRSPFQGNGYQAIHSDNPPVAPGGPWHTLQVVFAAGDITADMGATRLVPGSQFAPKHAHELIERTLDPQPGEIQLEAPEGSIVIFNGNCWHGGMTNYTDRRRYALFGTIKRGPRGGGQPRPTPPALARLPEAARFLFGDNVWLDDPFGDNSSCCWCCGIRRTCHTKGPVKVERLAASPDGRPVINGTGYTWGIEPSRIV